MPAASAMRAMARQSAQLADQRSGTRVAERPDEQLAPNRPILSALPLYIARRSRIDGVGRSSKAGDSDVACGDILEKLAAKCTASFRDGALAPGPESRAAGSMDAALDSGFAGFSPPRSQSGFALAKRGRPRPGMTTYEFGRANAASISRRTRTARSAGL